MVESYAVESRLSVVDELGPVLRRVARQARETQEAIARLTGSSKSAFISLTEMAGRLQRTLGEVPASATRMGESIAKAGDMAKVGLTGAAVQAERLQVALDRAGRAAGSIRVPTSGGGGGGGGGGGPGSRKPHDDGLDMMVGGGLVMLAGSAMLDAVLSPVQQAAKLQNARQALQRQLGSDPNAAADFATANAAAAAVVKANPSISMAAAISAFGDLYSVEGSAKTAAAMLGPLAAYQVASAAIDPAHPVDPYKALRAGELLQYSVDPKTHQFSPQRLTGFLNLLEQAQIESHGRVNADQMLNFATTGGLAAKSLSEQGLRYMIPVINEQGGFRAGTALSALSSQIVGGVMAQRQAGLWEQAGLLNPKDLKPTRTGVEVLPGAVKDSGLFQTSPVAWIETVLIPALRKQGDSDKQIQTSIQQMMGRQTGQRQAGLIAGQLVSIEKDYSQQLAAMPTDQTVQQMYGSNYDQNLLNLQGAYNTLMSQLGTSILPTVVPLMQSLTKALQTLGDDVAAHPTMSKDLLLVGGGLGGLATGLGALGVAIGGVKFAIEGLSGLKFLGSAAGFLATNPLALGVAAVIAGIALAVSPKLRGLANDLQAEIFGMVNSAVSGVGIEIKGLAAALGADIAGALLPGYGAVPGLPGGPLHLAPKVSLPQLQPVPHPDARRGSDGRIQRGGYSSETPPVAVHHTQINIDGKKVAAVVTKHQVQAARRPNKSSSSFDGAQAPSLPSHATALR